MFCGLALHGSLKGTTIGGLFEVKAALVASMLSEL